jgi:hypothetical protein
MAEEDFWTRAAHLRAATMPPRAVLLATLLAACARAARAHSRLVCPRPWDSSTALKVGPCGGASVAAHVQPAFTVQPGPLTIAWEESVPHAGSPARIALSVDGSDAGFEHCVLLDHIPHNNAPALPPVFGVDATYMRSALTVVLPNVRCERCVLQLVTLMTDALHGTRAGARCALPGTSSELPPCPAYFSCATIAINGTASGAAAACGAQPTDWPYAGRTPGVYDSAADSARWSGQGWLLDAPPAYRTPAGPCAPHGAAMHA